VIEVRGLTKRYGSTVAVDRLSFDVPPGAVTGFLGLNGSGKSTTMRVILGLDAPDAGHACIGGQAYHSLPSAITAVTRSSSGPARSCSAAMTT
jgi:ABC-2 type transport system ATP-binding protein